MTSRVVVVNLLPTLVTVILLYVLWRFFAAVQVGVMLFLLGMVLSAALYPVVRFLHERVRLPRPIAVFMTVFGSLFLVAAFVWFLVPNLIAELREAWQTLTTQSQFSTELRRFSQANPWVDRLFASDTPEEIGQSLRAIPKPLLNVALQVSSNLLTLLGYAFVVLLLMLYTLGRPEPLLQGLIGAIPDQYRARATRATEEVVAALRVWGMSTLLIMTSGGVLVWLGLTVIGVKNALMYGFLSALGELIPNLGPTVANSIPVLVTFAENPSKALIAAVWLITVQVIQGVVSPYLFGRTVELHPVSIIAGILLLGSSLGLIGAFLTVPFLIIVKVTYETFYLTRPELSDVPKEQVEEILEQA